MIVCTLPTTHSESPCSTGSVPTDRESGFAVRLNLCIFTQMRKKREYLPYAHLACYFEHSESGKAPKRIYPQKVADVKHDAYICFHTDG